MPFLLDTTALSELTKPQPNPGFLAWISERSTNETFIGAPSIGELEIGIHLLDPSEKRRALELWLTQLIADFKERILPFDTKASVSWGRAVGTARRSGHTLPSTDSQIAAIAYANDLAVVTRNVRHFRVDAFRAVTVLNPWT